MQLCWLKCALSPTSRTKLIERWPRHQWIRRSKSGICLVGNGSRRESTFQPHLIVLGFSNLLFSRVKEQNVFSYCIKSIRTLAKFFFVVSRRLKKQSPFIWCFDGDVHLNALQCDSETLLYSRCVRTVILFILHLKLLLLLKLTFCFSLQLSSSNTRPEHKRTVLL